MSHFHERFPASGQVSCLDGNTNGQVACSATVTGNTDNAESNHGGAGAEHLYDFTIGPEHAGDADRTPTWPCDPAHCGRFQRTHR